MFLSPLESGAVLTWRSLTTASGWRVLSQISEFSKILLIFYISQVKCQNPKSLKKCFCIWYIGTKSTKSINWIETRFILLKTDWKSENLFFDNFLVGLKDTRIQRYLLLSELLVIISCLKGSNQNLNDGTSGTTRPSVMLYRDYYL